MGNDICSNLQLEKPNFKQKIQEKEFIEQTNQILKQLNISMEDNYAAKVHRMTILKMFFYKQNHLIEHLKNQKSMYQQEIFLSFWKNNNYQQLDLYFENLVRKEKFEVMVNKYQHPKTVKYQKIFKITSLYQEYMAKGKQIIKQDKSKQLKNIVAIFLFANYYSFNVFKSNDQKKKQILQTFDEFTQLDGHETLFSLTMKKLEKFADQNQKIFPFLIIYYRAPDHYQISKFLKNFKYSGKVRLCMQQTMPILNQNGEVCLKGPFSHEFIEAQKGQHDFLNTYCKGQKIINLLKSQNKKIGIALNCMNIIDTPIDQLLIGKLIQSDEDVYYKCATSKTIKDSFLRQNFKRIVLCDNFLQIKDFQFFQERAFLSNLQKIELSPLWLGHFIFKIQQLYEANKKYNDKVNIKAMVQTKRIYTKYWNPYIQKFVQNQLCYKFSKDITNIFMNSNIRALGIQISEKNFLPIFSKNQFKQEIKIRQNEQSNHTSDSTPKKSDKDQAHCE